MTKEWFKAHLAELIGSVAALGLLILVWLNSRKSSGRVAPASGAITTPAISGGGGGQAGPSAADIQKQIQDSLQGYVTTAQEQTDLGALGASLQGLLSTTASQLQQAESQDVATVTGNLSQQAASLQALSAQFAAFANTQAGTNASVANQLATALQQAAQAAQQAAQAQQTGQNAQASLSNYSAQITAAANANKNFGETFKTGGANTSGQPYLGITAG